MPSNNTNSSISLQDNPADYSFFFDTSRRRTCYVAPERFVDDSSNSGRLGISQSMDIFSLGCVATYICKYNAEIILLSRCVIGELFTDGRQLFDLSQLLEFRGKHSEYTPETLLKKVDKPIRVHHCTCLVTSI